MQFSIRVILWLTTFIAVIAWIYATFPGSHEFLLGHLLPFLVGCVIGCIILAIGGHLRYDRRIMPPEGTSQPPEES